MGIPSVLCFVVCENTSNRNAITSASPSSSSSSSYR
ncbi:hypothetical protein M7I_6421 [Glarea lozoyensis 74030]|uniref:Uncharacterized protein n=1 Tax=Glarea lozoyensis (strain ATCC 74030 / MF5533) TaxID=1104152 RepID=H0EUG4_GLAL7|nr:hypothetical protein M7I_6421 [Glarea lozoyensis 74030]